MRLSDRAHLYFAYGADLSAGLMRRRCPDHRVLGAATLSGYALVFAGASRTWGGATLTAVPSQNDAIDGVLYLVSNLSLADLDRAQGCPAAYQRVTVRAGTGHGAADAHAYAMRPPLSLGAPAAIYLAVVAAEYHRLGFDLGALEVAIGRSSRLRLTN
ncbi:MAG: gamma-glutamylcyclotransferase family protein [Polyangiales bacterium]